MANIHQSPVTSISLYQLVFLNAFQLAAGATGLSSQGVTAVVHGCSVHALGPRVNLTHAAGGVAISVTCDYHANREQSTLWRILSGKDTNKQLSCKVY